MFSLGLHHTNVLKLLAGTHMLDIDMNLKTDRELYQTAQKRKFGSQNIGESNN
jgi:hypothetical protein